MHVYAAVVPPLQARQELAELIAAVRLRPADENPGRHRGAAGRLASLVRRRSTKEIEFLPTDGMLTQVDPADMRVHIASFGNLDTPGVRRLSAVLTEAAAEWPVPRLRVAGGVALDWPGDVGVWATLDGDVDALSTIARGVPKAVEQLRLYIDRRRFRPMVRLGSINDDTTTPYLEQLLEDLGSHHSAWWDQSGLPLLQLVAGSSDQRLEPFEEIPFGGPAAT